MAQNASPTRLDRVAAKSNQVYAHHEEHEGHEVWNLMFSKTLRVLRELRGEKQIMSLTPGAKLATFEITGLLGKGGYAEEQAYFILKKARTYRREKKGVLHRYLTPYDHYMRDTVMFSIISEEWKELQSQLRLKLL